ncbi:hypothetical protein BRARA_H00778 [Brassica rapa]|uniref:Uncharacterized protein n=1 Tax=Brassica campestris TaxID=3711 RepID=A0A397Y945_BRACM|nr:hypothetical protein BRARA_H00778 [Brassica rapa]
MENMTNKQNHFSNTMIFWSYSFSEHPKEDIPTLIEKIHEIKTSELRLDQPNVEEVLRYKLYVLSHNLGGAAILMYVINHPLIMISPAGFHEDSNLHFTLIEHTFLLLGPLLSRIVLAIYIPTRFFQMLLNKLALDFHNYPAVGGLVQTLMSYVIGGVMGLPHYNMNDMPHVFFRVVLHLAQMKHSSMFKMLDYDSVKANMEVYGSPKLIRPSMFRKHYKVMRETCVVEASYNEFEYAHLDFTFSHREELLAYVMWWLLLVEPTSTQPVHKKGMKLKNKLIHLNLIYELWKTRLL